MAKAATPPTLKRLFPIDGPVGCDDLIDRLLRALRMKKRIDTAIPIPALRDGSL